MRVLGIVLSLIMIIGCVPSAWAVDYTDEGKVVSTGYNGPEWGTKDLSKVVAWETTLLLLGFADWPIGKGPSYAVIAASALVLTAQRKERIDAELGIPSAKEARLAKESLVYGFMSKQLRNAR